MEHNIWEPYPVLIFYDILPYGSQGGPFAVISGSDRTAFMCFELANWKTQSQNLCVSVCWFKVLKEAL